MESGKLLELFPEFEEIQKRELKEKALQAMALAIEEGGWAPEDVIHTPTTLTWPDCPTNLVDHVRLVTRLCIKNFEELSPLYRANGVELNRDIVVCGALLHDIGKLTEFCCREGRIEHSESFPLIRHPLSGAILAQRAGLPAEIVHLIANHSYEGDKAYLTPEAAFVRSIDDFVFHCSIYGL